MLKSLALVAAFACLASGTSDYLIDVWTSEDGLPNSSVTALAQTPDGYLWIGTYNGLARFDGVRFVTFDPANTPALPRARIRRLHLGAGGTLWINTYDGSLASYRDGRFALEYTGDGSADATVTLVSSHPTQPVFLLYTGELIRRSPGTATNAPWQVLRPPGASSGELCTEDADGALWCRGRDQKLWRLTGDRFEPVSTQPGLDGQFINVLVRGPDGRIWVGTDREIAAWDGSRFVSQSPTNGERTLNVGFLHVTSEGDMWVIANGRVRKAQGRRWILEAEPCRGVFTGALDRLGMQEDRSGGVWLYHYGKGLFHIRPDGQTRKLALEEDFPGERVDCFFRDREGNLWAGVDRGGLVRLRQKHFSVLSPESGAAAPAAVTVAEDAQGAIWIGTFGGGLHRWQDGAWHAFSLPGGTRRGFVFSVCPDRGGRLWLSAGEEDLFVGTNGLFQLMGNWPHGVKSLLAADDGRVWLGTKSGLMCWAQGQFRTFRAESGVKRVDVRAFAESPNGVVWAGTGDGTLYRIESNHVTAFQPDDNLKSHPIWSLLADENDSVWVGTFRGGLLWFRNGRFVRYTKANGLPDDVICQILDDGRGQLWIGSQQGIFRVAKADLNAFAQGDIKSIECTAYGRYDGLPSLECSGGYQPAAWRTSDGRLLFATLKGVVSVRPEELLPNRLPPPVVVEEVVVDGTPETLTRSAGGGREPSPPQLAPVRLASGKRQIEFRFTGLSFKSPDRVRFRYKLDGLDKDWVEAGTRRSAQYSFLRPGDYRFQVTACNNEGVWNDQPAMLQLKVLPFFYETPWFLALVGLAVSASIAGTVRHFVVRRMRRELEQSEHQRAIERDRTRIAHDIHDELGSGLTHITLLSELARRDPPEQGHVYLGQISDMARELTRTMDEIVWAVSPQNDSLEGLMTYVCKFAQDYLKVAGIRCRLDLPAQLPACTLAAEVRHNLFLAAKETLNNVVKHAGATEVWLRLALRPDAFTISIEDNGRGLGGPTGRNETAAASTRISSGHGLENMEKRLTASGGRCVLSSEPGKGTRVEFHVRLAGDV